MTERKMIRRSFGLVLGVVCFVLIVAVGWIVAFYSSVVSDKNDTISSRDIQIHSLNYIITYQNSTISSLQNQVESLQDQAVNLHVYNAENFTILVNNETCAGGNVAWGAVNLSYPGYISVLVLSNTGSPSVEALYRSNGTDFDQKISLGSNGGTAIFPMPAPELIDILVTNASTDATWTITYFH